MEPRIETDEARRATQVIPVEGVELFHVLEADLCHLIDVPLQQASVEHSREGLVMLSLRPAGRMDDGSYSLHVQMRPATARVLAETLTGAADESEDSDLRTSPTFGL